MNKNRELCPICGSEHFTKKSIKESFEYKDKTIEIDDYIIYECGECEESIVDKKTLKDTEKIIRDFHREVNGLLTSSEIKNMRKALAFTQKDFSSLLGVSEKSFARYESCAVTQNRAMDYLIRLVFEKPDNIPVLHGFKIEEEKDSLEVSGNITYNYRKDHDSRYQLENVG